MCLWKRKAWAVLELINCQTCISSLRVETYAGLTHGKDQAVVSTQSYRDRVGQCPYIPGPGKVRDTEGEGGSPLRKVPE